MTSSIIIRPIGIFNRTYRHAQRYRQILSVLLKYGFGDLIARLKIESYLELGLSKISSERVEKMERLSTPERFRKALEELGPTFIKFGQMVSTQRDVLPADFVAELVKLQDRVPPFPDSELDRIVEEELDATIADVFSEFNRTPLAAGSIGQVHKARMAGEGIDVVVKVQRPNIQKVVEVDLEIMMHIATLMEKHIDGMDVHKPTKLVEEFGRVLSRELDYTIEASNQARFARQFEGDDTVYIPRVFTEASSSRILTMEFVKGTKPAGAAHLREHGLDPRIVAERGFDLLMKQIFQFGYFHGDPHPGNHIIRDGNVICYIDFGMMGHLSRREREEFADLVVAIASRKPGDAADAFIRLADWEKEPDRNRLEKAVDDFMNMHLHRPLKEMELGRLLQELVDLVTAFQMRLPESFLLVIKALATIEGLGKSLDEDFNPIVRSEPFLREFLKERYHPKRIAEDVIRSGGEFLRFVGELPWHLREIFRQLKTGKAKLEFEHMGLEPFLNTLEHVASRLALAILVGSLVIGSAVIVLSGIPPKYNEIPIIGIGGFLIAGVLAFWLVINILRERR